MKKLFIILLMLVCSCASHKTKTKQKEKDRSEMISQQKAEIHTTAQTSLQSNTTDSGTQKMQFSADRYAASSLQDLQLTNNGKCAAGGEIRFVRFTDAQGNQAEIPVNDNTDLSFRSTNELEKQNATLSSEIAHLKQENRDLQYKVDQKEKQAGKTQVKASASATQSDTDAKTATWPLFLLCAVLSVVAWEILKKYSKTIFYKP